MPNEPLMFPAEIDRFRLIGLIVRWKRENLEHQPGGLKRAQDTIANNLGVDQSTISRLERISRRAPHPKEEKIVKALKLGTSKADREQKKLLNLSPEENNKLDNLRKENVGREVFIKICTWGVKFEPKYVDALLWLYGQDTLRYNEIRNYISSYAPDYRTQDYGPTGSGVLRKHILELIDEICGDKMAYNSIDGVYTNAKVSILFEANEEEYYRTNEEIGKINSMDGQRMLLTALPSLSTFPPHLVAQGASLDSLVITDMARKRHIQMSLESQRAFLDHIRWFGERSIHHKESIKDYFTNEDGYDIRLAHRREQLKYWITLIQDYEHYEVGLIDVIPDLELSMKGISVAMMRGDYTNPSNKLNLESKRQILWPRYIHWSDEFTALSFYLAFELFWDAIPDPWRTKKDVIAFLQKLLQ